MSTAERSQIAAELDSFGAVRYTPGMWMTSFVCLCVVGVNPILGNRVIGSFEQAKHELMGLYAEHRQTIYSDCAFDDDKAIDYRHCDYVPRRNNNRAHRIEWEHVVPAEAFGQAFAAWREGHPMCRDSRGHAFHGRRCAARADPSYRRMEGDLYNLYPEIGEVNRLRSNYSMAEIAGNEGQLAPLPIKVANHKFEPRPGAKGDIARTYLYMNAAYPGHGIISDKNTSLFASWNLQDPVDAWECDRALRIEALQGNENPFVMQPCLAKGLIAQAQRKPFAAPPPQP